MSKVTNRPFSREREDALLRAAAFYESEGVTCSTTELAWYINKTREFEVTNGPDSVVDEGALVESSIVWPNSGELAFEGEPRPNPLKTTTGTVDRSPWNPDLYSEGRAWDELPRTNYLILPKRALCSMPSEWQERFFDAIDELKRTLEMPVTEVSGYHVQAYSDCHYSPEDDETVYDYCDDPLADYRHTGPLPRKTQGDGR